MENLKYIKEMVPNVSSEIVLQLKNLKPGNCIAFGSAFKVPTIMYIDLNIYEFIFVEYTLKSVGILRGNENKGKKNGPKR